MQTFATSLNQWLLLRCLNKRPKTQEFYRYCAGIVLTNFPEPEITAESITTELLLSFAQSISHVSPSVWNTAVAALRHITPCAKCLERRRLRVREFTPPSQLLFDNFLALVDANPRTRAGIVVRFLVLTGLRKGEAFGLRWENVCSDFITIPAELCKSGVRRTIPMLPGVDDVLKRLRSMDGGEFVLPRGNPRKVIEITSRRVFGKQWSLHSFRHLFATKCIESGIPIPVVAAWLGHQDKGVTLTRSYLHLTDEQMRREARKVNMLSVSKPAALLPGASRLIPFYPHAIMPPMSSTWLISNPRASVSGSSR